LKEQWLFIDNLPVLYPERNVSHQLQIEMWLDITPMLEALELKKVEHPKERKPEVEAYVV